jgi:plasmid stabilization system protein ParE
MVVQTSIRMSLCGPNTSLERLSALLRLWHFEPKQRRLASPRRSRSLRRCIEQLVRFLKELRQTCRKPHTRRLLCRHGKVHSNPKTVEALKLTPLIWALVRDEQSQWRNRLPVVERRPVLFWIKGKEVRR